MYVSKLEDNLCLAVVDNLCAHLGHPKSWIRIMVNVTFKDRPVNQYYPSHSLSLSTVSMHKRSIDANHLYDILLLTIPTVASAHFLSFNHVKLFSLVFHSQKIFSDFFVFARELHVAVTFFQFFFYSIDDIIETNWQLRWSVCFLVSKPIGTFVYGTLYRDCRCWHHCLDHDFFF